MIPVRILEIRQETPTVKSLRLDLIRQDFTFHPGQWVDCYAEIGGERLVAGYTLTSSATIRETIELAVMEGDNSVTKFIHGRRWWGTPCTWTGGRGTSIMRGRWGIPWCSSPGGSGSPP